MSAASGRRKLLKMADVNGLVTSLAWTRFLQFLVMLSAGSAALLRPSHEKDPFVLGNDRYEMPNGSPDWCLLCRGEDLVKSHNFEPQCEEKNSLPKEISYDEEGYSNVLWCSGLGKPPKCAKPELPAHTYGEANDPGHQYHTHTYITLTCEAGYHREALASHPPILQCNGNPPVWNSSALESFQCVINSTSELHFNDTRVRKVSNKTNIKPGNAGSQETIGIVLGALCLCGLAFIPMGLCYYKRRSCGSACTKHTDDQLKKEEETIEHGVTDQMLPDEACTQQTEDLLKKEEETIEHGVTVTDQMLPDEDSQQDNAETSPQVLQDSQWDNAETSPQVLQGCGGDCKVLLSELETYDKGNVRKEIVDELNLDERLGYDQSWIGLAKTELDYKDVKIGNIKRCNGTDRSNGPASVIITDMTHHGKKVGHLVDFLYKQHFQSLIKRILEYHLDCSFCKQRQNQTLVTS